MTWSELLSREDGSVIVEVGNKVRARFWWTRDDVISLAPVSPPAIHELDLFAFEHKEVHPFVHWCFERYLSPETGRATMAYPVEASFEFHDDGSYADMITALFQSPRVVIITFARKGVKDRELT